MHRMRTCTCGKFHPSFINKKCLFIDLNDKIFQKTTTCLKKHLKAKHEGLWLEYKSLSDAEQQKNLEQENQTASKKKKPKKHEKSEILSLCVDICVDGGRPLSIFRNDKSMRKLIELACKGSNEAIVITEEKVRDAIFSEANNLKKNIIKKLKGNIISISGDFATCHNRQFLGKLKKFAMA